MFTYIKFKNFLSFKDVLFDFNNGKKGPKKFVAIYGENGSGKSNFISGIDFLRRTINSFIKINNIEEIVDSLKKENLPNRFLEELLSNFDLLTYAKSCRMINCREDTTIEYGFRIKGHDGYYIVSFNDRFVYEKLYYFTGKQRGTLFEISNKDKKSNFSYSGKLFKNPKLIDEWKGEIDKYWGKHTFLGILKKELDEKNEDYITNNFSEYLLYIFKMFNNITLHYKKSSDYGIGVISSKPQNILYNLLEGKIERDDEKLLNCSENILRVFFTQAYADIKNVYYERSIVDDKIKYNLFAEKMIGGKIRKIDFNRESAGTQHLLDIIKSLLGVFCGVTVVFDEIDNGIHDLLLKAVLTSMVDDINGQLIITTHNTYLLEAIDIKSVYIISVDYKGNKIVKCLDEYHRIQGTNNPRIMYLKGLFGGVPIVDTIDYDEILSELSDDNLYIE